MIDNVKLAFVSRGLPHDIRVFEQATQRFVVIYCAFVFVSAVPAA